jgi:hypothetical protein
VKRPLSPLSRAADAIEEIRDDLRGLPLTPEVRALHGKWVALRTVLYGTVFQRQPALTEAQQSRLVADVGSFVREVAAVYGRGGA